MNNALLFDFTINKDTKTAVITREFDASQSLVWDAFTKQELLDQWWAPQPWMSRTKEMNFEAGGKRFYAMVSPEGQEHWALQQYISISPITHFKLLNAFADKEGNPSLPGSEWDLYFSEHPGPDGNPVTTVRVSIYNESLERMEKMIEMGFQQGFTMTLDYLEKLLVSLQKG